MKKYFGKRTRLLMRKCRLKSCKAELPKTKDCTDIVQKKGFCGYDCLTEYGRVKAQEQRERQERKKQRERKERLKTKSDHLREAQAAFNAYIRERDKGKPCISCGKYPNNEGVFRASKIDAGHYRSIGANPELRFEETNCHLQCVKCNRELSGNTVNYRINLVQRIGQEAVDWLEGPHEPKKYTIEEVKEIKREYRRKLRELQNSEL